MKNPYTDKIKISLLGNNYTGTLKELNRIIEKQNITDSFKSHYKMILNSHVVNLGRRNVILGL